MSSNQNKLKLIQLRSEGCSYKEIAKKIGVSKPTVIKWSRELSSEISNQEQLEHEALLRCLDFTRQNRVKKLKAICDKLELELKKRDLSDLLTGKIIEQLIKIYDSWDTEEVKISFKSKEMNTDIDPYFDEVGDDEEF